MTDFRALCAELLRELDHASAWDYQQALKDQARAALAEPQPAAAGDVAELVTGIRHFLAGYGQMRGLDPENIYSIHLGDAKEAHITVSRLTRAAELLERLSDGPAVPASVVEQPSEQELKTFACKWWRTFGFVKDKATCEWVLDQVAPEHFADYARDVLARWGSPAPQPTIKRLPDGAQVIEPEAHTLLVPAPQPIPVAERLPEAGDCDAEGRCWLGGQQMGEGTPTWLLGFPAWAERFPEVHRYWLPAHALPLPSRDGSTQGESNV